MAYFSLLQSVHTGSGAYPGGKSTDELTAYHYLVPRLRTSGTIPIYPYTPSWYAHGKLSFAFDKRRGLNYAKCEYHCIYLIILNFVPNVTILYTLKNMCTHNMNNFVTITACSEKRNDYSKCATITEGREPLP
jgi:hypothetical protein